MADRVSQEAIEALLAGAGKARVSQDAVEALLAGAGKARVSQTAIEALVAHTGANAGVSQVAVEVLIQNLHEVDPSFISSRTAVHPPTLESQFATPAIASRTIVRPPTLLHVEVDVPFIASRTRVFGIMSLFGDQTGSGAGNGGESFAIRLAPNGTSVTATLAAAISDTGTLLELTGDGGLPTTEPFVLTVDSEVLYVAQITAGLYRVRGRGMSNTTPAAHLSGAAATWTDSYDQAIESSGNIDASFTADIASTGMTTYAGWLICFDSSQAYLAGARYPTHVSSVLGVFAAGAGSTGTSKCDAAQPNAIATPAGVSDDCPAALSNPARISSNIVAGDIAVVRYTNPEAAALDLGPRACALQSWFGLKRVDATDTDVTFTDPTGYVVDSIPPAQFTGSVNGEWLNPSSIGIAPATGEPTPNSVPYTSVTLPGSDRYFTYGSPHYGEKGWPMCCIAVRQGTRRIPFWQSWDWHDFGYVYAGFGVDDTFAQLLVNRNGILYSSVPEVDLPGPQDIDGPDAVWDDGSYEFAASWYVIIFGTPYLVVGPIIGGGDHTLGPGTDFIPGVDFPGTGSGVVIDFSPLVEGGSGGGIDPFTAGHELFQAAVV